MFADRLEISSPGSFFEGESLKKTYDLSAIISKRRNELICGVLVSCGVMEAAATGFDKVAEDYRNADEAHRPFIFSSSDHFTLVLPDLTYDDGVASSDLPTLLFVPVPSGGAHDDAILSACYATARTAKDIAQTIGLSDSSYFRKCILGNLVEHGYLEKSAYLAILSSMAIWRRAPLGERRITRRTGTWCHSPSRMPSCQTPHPMPLRHT